MNTNEPAGGSGPAPTILNAPSPRLAAVPVAVGLLSWVMIAFGFLGLRMLMQERPQFVGPPMRSSTSELVQESPRVVVRRVTDDIAAIKPAQPESSEVQFDLRGHRDHRGLRTVLDMSGSVVARHVLTNANEEPLFVLFRALGIERGLLVFADKGGSHQIERLAFPLLLVGNPPTETHE
jgi:hypothetical protein